MGRALVTGAARRLGRSMSLCLAQMGFDVAVHYAQSEAEAASCCDEIKSMDRRACMLRADILDEAETEQLVARAAHELGGPIDCLINNASIFEYDAIATATRTSWDRHFESNLRAPFVLTQEFARQFEEPLFEDNGEKRARGVVINMIDQRVRKLTPEFMTYTLAKSALWTLTQTSARALAPVIRVNAIGPGPTLQGARQSREHFAAQRASVILERGPDGKEINDALKYIVNAPSVTGQLFCIDGGQHLGWQTPDVLGVE